MAEYKNEEPCEFIYSITAVEKVVDGDTIDAVFDLGFDVRICNRIRLLGIDTPESRTRDLEEKFYGKLSSAALKSWVHWAVMSDRDDIEIQCRCPESDSRGKFGRVLGELWIIFRRFFRSYVLFWILVYRFLVSGFFHNT